MSNNKFYITAEGAEVELHTLENFVANRSKKYTDCPHVRTSVRPYAKPIPW